VIIHQGLLQEQIWFVRAHLRRHAFLPTAIAWNDELFALLLLKKFNLVGPIQTPEGRQPKGLQANFRSVLFEDVQLENDKDGCGLGRRLYGDLAVEALKLQILSKLPVKSSFL